MQFHAAQQPTPETTRKGRQTKSSTPAGRQRHAVRMRLGTDGFSLEIESGNSVLIFAIAALLVAGLTGLAAILKIF